MSKNNSVQRYNLYNGKQETLFEIGDVQVEKNLGNGFIFLMRL